MTDQQTPQLGLPTFGGRPGVVGPVSFGFTVVHVIVALALVSAAFVFIGPGGYFGWLSSTILFVVVMVFYRYDSTIRRRATPAAKFFAIAVSLCTGLGLVVSGFGQVTERELTFRSPDVPTTWEPTREAFNHSGYFTKPDDGPMSRVVVYKVPGNAKAAARGYVNTLLDQDWEKVSQSGYVNRCLRSGRFDFRDECTLFKLANTTDPSWTHLEDSGIIVTIHPVQDRLVRVTTMPDTTFLDDLVNGFLDPPKGS